MPDKPCTHCGGSGREPDLAEREWDRIRTHIAAAKLPGELDKQLHYDAFNMRSAHLAVEEQQQARITFLEAALRDILGHVRVPEERPGNAFISQFQASYESLDGWRAILDGNPPKVTTINQARAGHGLPPFEGALGQTPVSAYQPLVCGICGRAADETWKPPCNDCPLPARPGGC